MAKHPKGASTRRSNVRHGRQRRSNAWMNGLRVVATTALVLVLSGVSVAAYAVWDLANKVQTVDGRWLSIDGRVLFKANVAASET